MKSAVLRRCIIFLGFSLAVLLTSGCSLFQKPTAVLWTNRPEIASYVEVFNARQDVYKIEVEYKESPSQALLDSQEAPDILIGERLTSASIKDQFSPLDKLYKKEMLDPSIFYKDLLAYCKSGGEQILLPVAFDMPVIIFRSGEEVESVNKFFFSYEELKKLSGEFTEGKDDKKTKMGFVTYWEPSFLYFATQHMGAGYRETAGGQLAWNDVKLKELISYFKDWSDTANGGYAAEQQFTDKYLYSPGYKLVNTGRIRFYFMELKDFLSIPEEKRTNIDFRWLSYNGKILISDNMLFLGVPQRAKNKKAAYAFISWFFNGNTQTKLMENIKLTRLRSFGIAQGFSSIQWVTQREIPRIHPELVGHIPPPEYFQLPDPLPVDWKQMKSQVIVPYLHEAVGNNTTDTLENRLRTWFMQRPGGK